MHSNAAIVAYVKARNLTLRGLGIRVVDHLAFGCLEYTLTMHGNAQCEPARHYVVLDCKLVPLHNACRSLPAVSHTRTVVRECCKDDDQSQWEKPKFDPRLPKPLNRSSPKFTYVITSWISVILQNFIQIG